MPSICHLMKTIFPPAGLVLLLATSLLHAQSVENLLLVLNEDNAISLEVGKYYAEKRGVPASNILRIKTRSEDEISRADYERQIEAPIGAWLARASAQDRILYIVLTKGIPLRVAGTSGTDGTVASVDSELTLLYRKMTSVPFSAAGRIANPYFLGEASIAGARRFTHETQDIYLVCRLDGYTSSDIRGLIDRGFAPGKEGRILLDERGPSQSKGDSWLQTAADRLAAIGFQDRVVLESTDKVLKDENGILGYYSWGSNDPAIRARHLNLGFLPGALAGMFVSSDARTFTAPPPEWRIGSWGDKNSYFAGSPQSLAGDLISDGVTGVAGHVSEPYLESTIRPNILFPAYLSGFNLIESFYLAMPSLSWQTVVVGDPLCAPFRTQALTPGEIDKGIELSTDLPSFFSARCVRNLALPAYRKLGIQPEVVKLALRAQSRLARGDKQGARQALEEATAKDSRLAREQFLLASLYEEAGEYDKAIERYRRLLESSPDNALVLNNLAYALAVRKNSPAEALPLAEKAYSVAKGSANIVDTLGWIHHLMGNNDKASQLLGQAVTLAPQNADIQLHYAILSAEMGNTTAAEDSLRRALEIDRKLEEREEVRQLRARLKGKYE